MRRNRIPQYVALCAIAAVAGCATVESPPPAKPQPAAPPVQAAAPAAPPKAAAVRGPASNAATMDEYKKHVAEHIHKKNSRDRADSLPPMLTSVVVLRISVDGDGKPVAVVVMRPGQGGAKFDNAAVASVHRSAPLPAPTPALLGADGTVSFVETWLFRADANYQVRSTAENQILVVPSSGVATRKGDKK